MATGTPRISVTEHDFSVATIGSSGSDFASVGKYTWGAVNSPRKLALGQTEFVTRYGLPNKSNYIDHAIVNDHFRMNSSIWVNRVAGVNASNANTDGSFIRIDNDQAYQAAYHEGLLNNIPFVGRYPGSLVNDVRIDVVTKDTFDTWEYKDSFKEEPLKFGEFHVAVIDTSGRITGNGAVKQVERLSFTTRNLTTLSSTMQEELLTVSCTTPVWTSGNKQTTKISIVGKPTTDTLEISVLGNIVNLTSTMSEEQVIDEIKKVLINTKLFLEVSYTIDGLKVIYLDAAPQPVYSPVSTSGVQVNYQVVDAGWLEYKFQYNSIDVVYRYAMYSPIANHANGIAYQLAHAIENSKALQIGNSSSYGNVVSVRRSVAGGVYPLSNFFGNGIVITSSVETVGSITTAITFDKQRLELTITNPNKVDDVIAAIQTYLLSTNRYESVVQDKQTLVVTHKSTGYVKPLPSVYESGIVINSLMIKNGFSGRILEKYQNLKGVEGAKKSNGMDAYYLTVINKYSNYIWVGEDLDTTCSNTFKLLGGLDDYNVSLQHGIEQFSSKTNYNIRGMFIYSDDVFDVKTAVTMAKIRMDMVVYVSLPRDVVFRNPSDRAMAAVEWRNYTFAESTSYAFISNNWGEFYDPTSDSYQWIPDCGGVSGVVARLFITDQWHKSPAGIQRGGMPAYRNLAWQVTDEENDLLYDNEINCVRVQDGQTVLWAIKLP